MIKVFTQTKTLKYFLLDKNLRKLFSTTSELFMV